MTSDRTVYAVIDAGNLFQGVYSTEETAEKVAGWVGGSVLVTEVQDLKPGEARNSVLQNRR